MEELDRWMTMLEGNGGRITTPRRIIVDILVNARCAMEPLEIYDRVRMQNPQVGLVTVYRTLDLLIKLGLVERIHLGDGCHMVLRAARGHEHVVLCTECGKAEYFAGENISAWIEKISRESGFKIQSHWLQLQGLCEECQQKQDFEK